MAPNSSPISRTFDEAQGRHDCLGKFSKLSFHQVPGLPIMNSWDGWSGGFEAPVQKISLLC
jgi:hypothetical protein